MFLFRRVRIEEASNLALEMGHHSSSAVTLNNYGVSQDLQGVWEGARVGEPYWDQDLKGGARGCLDQDTV